MAIQIVGWIKYDATHGEGEPTIGIHGRDVRAGQEMCQIQEYTLKGPQGGVTYAKETRTK